jgi:hypothetical protein
MDSAHAKTNSETEDEEPKYTPRFQRFNKYQSSFFSILRVNMLL